MVSSNPFSVFKKNYHFAFAQQETVEFVALRVNIRKFVFFSMTF